MRPPTFWWRKDRLAARLLQPAALVYGAVAAWRLGWRGEAVGVPILCVGDLTVGGAGKTPAALAIGEILRAACERPFFLTRGYGGTLAGPARVDPLRHGSDEVGDEALLLAAAAPTIVARDRVAGARAAVAAGATMVVMDDGFQNPALDKDLALLVIDGARGIGNGRVFPAGPMRAPLRAQLDRAHVALVVGDASPETTPLIRVLRERRMPLFHGRLAPDAARVSALAGASVLAFAGIGNPEKFFATLAAAGIAVPITRSFPDHHRYTSREIADLLACAEGEKLVPVTTEKDFVRLAAMTGKHASAMRDRLHILPVKLVIEEADEFARLILEASRRTKV
jgi:tetraacyldisaccharide 4'-kinase